MPRLTPAEQRSRLAYDYKVMRGLDGRSLDSWRGFVSHADAAAGVEATPAQGAAGLVTLYSVTFASSMLSAPDVRLRKATALFDLLAGGNYPSSPPAVQFTSQPLPFCTRVAPGSGIVCIGSGWTEARGHMLLAQLVVHTLRLVNFDEPAGGDAGLNHVAYSYWQTALRGRPLDPDLVYPTMAEETTHEVVPAERVAVVEATGFRPRRLSDPSTTSMDWGTGFRRARSDEAIRPAGVRL
jgi:hypothetical protein